MTQPTIPIKNLYYLLCYSWDQLEQGELIDVERCPSTELVDLFTLVLCDGVRHLSRRGLEQSYQLRTEVLSTLRGRIDAFGSARKFLPSLGKAVCQFDELTVNSLNNRLIKATLKKLSVSKGLNSELRKQTVIILKSLRNIEDIVVTKREFQKVQLHSNTRFYRFLLNVCELIHDSSLVETQSGSTKFREFVRDEKAMARVFERFLYNFIQREIQTVKVKRDRIEWQATSLSDPSLALLPSMNTDISISRGADRLIVDAKYYTTTLSSRWETEKIHSHNLYQLLSYLNNAPKEGIESTAGMLIYPKVDKSLRQRYVINGFPVCIATVDLNQDWPLVHAEMVDLVDFAFNSKVT
ncbi:hypothetical protein AEP_00064 [Curvibacter sp. AEP1-3]|uniref:5-methylcytosine-specific restriction endonuclease system specificity protein McrC n=1 Tax=Curvibacter sp. AEP1-3 TaxID=1844971 RepID=UPI000B54D20C|nr:5-methylcytosine-specific restriction endonuclease system specificity protein McrC [Curvibacter sp. AEP1-3]ARV17030.1 hypothetical protein AEP_00064 [Curvibacter sp. AEP1-3]